MCVKEIAYDSAIWHTTKGVKKMARNQPKYKKLIVQVKESSELYEASRSLGFSDLARYGHELAKVALEHAPIEALLSTMPIEKLTEYLIYYDEYSKLRELQNFIVERLDCKVDAKIIGIIAIKLSLEGQPRVTKPFSPNEEYVEESEIIEMNCDLSIEDFQ